MPTTQAAGGGGGLLSMTIILPGILTIAIVVGACFYKWYSHPDTPVRATIAGDTTRLGGQSEQEGKLFEKLRQYDEAIKREPDNADLHAEKAKVALQLRNYKVAEEELAAALSRDPENYGNLLDHAFAAFYLQQYDKSIADYKKLLRRNASDAKLLYGPSPGIPVVQPVLSCSS